MLCLPKTLVAGLIVCTIYGPSPERKVGRIAQSSDETRIFCPGSILLKMRRAIELQVRKELRRE
jgi:hypothetical protein